MSTIAQALAHMFNSKTYTLLILLTVIGLTTAIIADAAFHRDLWQEFYYQLFGNSGGAVIRAGAVDAAPKVAAAWKDPSSPAANPPPAITKPIPSAVIQAQPIVASVTNVPPPDSSNILIPI